MCCRQRALPISDTPASSFVLVLFPIVFAVSWVTNRYVPPPQLQSNCQYNSKKEGTQKRTTGKCQAITMDKWKNKRAALFVLVCSRSAENAQKNEPGPLSGRSATCGDNRKPSTIGSACASLRLAAFAFCVNEIAAQVARLAKLLYCAACAIVAKALQKLRRAAA